MRPEPDNSRASPPPSTLRWQILRRAIRRQPSPDSENVCDNRLNQVSRRGNRGFNLIPCHVVDGAGAEKTDYLPKKDACVCYTLPLPNGPNLFLRQRMEDSATLDDFEICNRYEIDNTGLVCGEIDEHINLILSRGDAPCAGTFFSTQVYDESKDMFPTLCSFEDISMTLQHMMSQWPSEDVLAYYSMSHPDTFRHKRVIELGSGYGLAGFVIAMVTEASEVVISDGNPQVVNYIQQNIDANSGLFGGTKVKSMLLHWDQIEVSEICGTFDVIVASDCTFFKEFHKGLARTIRCLLKEDGPSKAILLSPKRGDSLDKFLMEFKDDDSGLHYTITETYDTQISSRHKKFLDGDDSWPNYDPDHCYPLLVTITR